MLQQNRVDYISRKSRYIGIVVLIFITCILIILSESSRIFPTKNQIQNILQDLGILAPIGYVVLYGFLSPFFVPNFIFLLTAGAIWPTYFALMLAMLGASLACSVGFLFARYIARDWVSSHLPQKFKNYDEAMVENSFGVTIAIRLVFFMTPPSHWFLGLSSLKFTRYLVGSVIGIFPSIAVYIFIGNWLTSKENYSKVILLVIIAFLFKLIIVYFWHKKLSQDAEKIAQRQQIPDSVVLLSHKKNSEDYESHEIS